VKGDTVITDMDGCVEFPVSQHNTTQHNTTQHNTTQHTLSQGGLLDNVRVSPGGRCGEGETNGNLTLLWHGVVWCGVV
jgi:hypothetical protein